MRTFQDVCICFYMFVQVIAFISVYNLYMFIFDLSHFEHVEGIEAVVEVIFSGKQLQNSFKEGVIGKGYISYLHQGQLPWSSCPWS